MANANDSVGKLKRLQASARDFLDEKGMASPEGAPPSFLRQAAHFLLLAGRSFVRNRCPVRAAALAYSTLLALIPLLAVAISVTTGLMKTKGGEEQVQAWTDKLISSVVPQLDLLSKTNVASAMDGAGPGTASATAANVDRQEVSRRVNEFIGNIRSGTLGVTGMAGLVMVAILMLSRIESTFNDIWGVTQGRSWLTRVAYYWATITLGPVVLFLVVGLTTGSAFSAIQHWADAHVPVIGSLSWFLPFVILSLAFAGFYQFMPNTKVHWQAALVGGIVGGCLWQLNNLCNQIYVSKVVSNSKIYGSLSVIPVFLIGLYFSWMILLLGAQVSYAWQNRHAYAQAKQADTVNQRGKEFIALRIMGAVGSRFQYCGQTPTAADLADRLAVPSRLVGQILQVLVNARLIVEVAGPEIAYAPARPLSQITLQDVLVALRAGQGQELATREDATRQSVREEFERIMRAEMQAAAATSLEALVVQAPAGESAPAKA